MKRIFSILAVVCLIVSLAVPTLAAETYTVKGEWVFNHTLKLLDTGTDLGRYINYTVNGKSYNYLGVSGVGITVVSYGLGNDPNQVYEAYRSDRGWKNDNLRYIDFGDTPQTVSEAFYTWLVASAVAPPCDGTTCNLADTNYDAVCDSCGMPVAMSMRSTMLPDFNHLLEGEYAYATVSMRSTGEYQVMLTKDPSVYTDGNVLVQAPLRGYRLTSDGEWVFGSQSDTPSYITSSNYVGANHAVKDFATGEVWADANFPLPPLWMMVQGGIPITELQPKVVGTMGTLALCGVGCLALLVVLSLFGKRSLISLK